MRFLNLILILLMWTEMVFATTTTNNNQIIGKTLKVALEYVTSMSKIDGSFESGNTGWVASVGTITPTASTEFQGNYKGLWSATGTGTLDLQWTATASNTYEASAIVSVGAADSDHYVCAVVNGVETGCTLFDGPNYTPNKQIKVSAIADSVKGASFYLRIKHTGTDAFNLSIDDGKIQPWTPQTVQTVEQESIVFNGASAGAVSTLVNFTSVDSFLSNYSNILSYVNDGSSGTKVIVKKKSVVTINVGLLSNGVSAYFPTIYKNGSLVIYGSQSTNLNYAAVNSITLPANSGDYFQIYNQQAGNAAGYGIFSVTATAVRDNVVQSWQAPDTIGEIKYLPQNVAPNGFIPANGITIGYTSGTYQGAAYFDLYKVLWSIATTTSTDPYYISSAKGASADADWAANKTIKIDESGLFTRAYLAGTTGAVGTKQADAFQGHWHAAYVPSTAGATSLWGFGVQNSRSTTLGEDGSIMPIRDARTDTVNGTPRAAAETRPTNVAKYAFIRYASSAPTLYALPTRSEIFSANVSIAGVVTNATQNFVTSCTNAAPSVCTLWSNFGVTPICWATPIDITKRAEVTTSSTTSLTVGRTDTSTAFNLFCHLK